MAQSRTTNNNAERRRWKGGNKSCVGEAEHNCPKRLAKKRTTVLYKGNDERGRRTTDKRGRELTTSELRGDLCSHWGGEPARQTGRARDLRRQPPQHSSPTRTKDDGAAQQHGEQRGLRGRAPG